MRRWIFLLGVGLLGSCAPGPYDYAVVSPDYYDYGPYYYGSPGPNLFLAPPGFHREYYGRVQPQFYYQHAPPSRYGRAAPPSGAQHHGRAAPPSGGPHH